MISTTSTTSLTDVPVQPLTAERWGVLTAQHKVRERIPWSVLMFVAFLLCFILTTFRTPIPRSVFLVYRWAALAGVFGFFFLRRRSGVKGFPVTVILYLFVCLLSALNAEAWLLSSAKLMPAALSIGLMLFLLPAVLKPHEYRKLFELVAWMLVGLSAMSFVWGAATGKLAMMSRYQSLYRGPNSEGAYLAFAFLSGLWLISTQPRRIFKFFAQFMVAVNLACIYATGSRASFIGALGGAMVWGATQLIRSQSQRRRRFIITLMVLGAAVIIQRGIFVRGWEMMSRGGITAEDFFASRIYIWQDSIEAFKRHPWLGYGFGVGELADADEEVGTSAIGSVRDGSGYMGMLESVGALGVIAFVLVIIQVSLKEKRLITRRITSDSAVMAHAAFAQIAFLLLNLIGEVWILGPGNPTFQLFWFYLGATVYFSNLAYSEWRREIQTKRQAIFNVLVTGETISSSASAEMVITTQPQPKAMGAAGVE